MKYENNIGTKCIDLNQYSFYVSQSYLVVFKALLLSFPMKGFPESVVAAALSRIGMKVLHLDRSVNT